MTGYKIVREEDNFVLETFGPDTRASIGYPQVIALLCSILSSMNKEELAQMNGVLLDALTDSGAIVFTCWNRGNNVSQETT